MRAGLMNQKITFQAKTITVAQDDDGSDVNVITWADAFSEWAAVERLSEQVSRFTIHYRAGIRPNTHRIVFEDTYWTITSAVPDSRHIDLMIDCDFSDQVEVTTLESTTREYITDVPLVRTPSEE